MFNVTNTQINTSLHSESQFVTRFYLKESHGDIFAVDLRLNWRNASTVQEHIAVVV